MKGRLTFEIVRILVPVLLCVLLIFSRLQVHRATALAKGLANQRDRAVSMAADPVWNLILADQAVTQIGASNRTFLLMFDLEGEHRCATLTSNRLTILQMSVEVRPGPQNGAKPVILAPSGSVL